tara:strand:- start:7485 stop:7841 length:357 start_codon:yes stop_codon:yes gene_type:complete
MFYGCLNNTNDEIKNGPEIYLSYSLINDSIINDSNLFLEFVVGDINGVHDVDISIYNEKSGELCFTKFFDHIHDNLFELETNINISNFKKNENYMIIISANDMTGNINIDTTMVYLKN